MTPDEAMMRKLDDAGLHRARLMVAADLTHVVVDKARRLTEVPDPESEAFWLAYQGMFDAVRALDAMRLRDTIATSEQIVRDGPIYDLPCGHTVFDACEACTPDPDAQVFDIPGPLVDNRRAEVARRAHRYDQCDEVCTTDCGHCKGNYSEVRQARQAARTSAALTEHEAGVDAFVSRPEFGGAK
jgi:hypothetical protein